MLRRTIGHKREEVNRRLEKTSLGGYSQFVLLNKYSRATISRRIK
jgi:hypothetical protein